MNYLVSIIVALVGIALGTYIARQKAKVGFIAKPLDCARDKQTEQKAENKLPSLIPLDWTLKILKQRREQGTE